MKKLYKNVLSIAILAFGFNTVNAQINYSEDFESGMTGWTGTYFTTSLNPCEGSQSVRDNIYTASGGSLTSPLVGTSNGGIATLDFTYKIINYSGGGATPATFGSTEVQYAATASGPWVTIFTIDASNHTPSTSCATFSPVFTPPIGDVYIRFNTTYGTGDYYFYSDAINITQGVAPSCPSPSFLNAAWIDNDSVIMTWNAGLSETNWNVELGATGFTPGSGTQLHLGNVNALTDTIGGLTQLTDYEVYIQADCGADSSLWVGPLLFTTTANCPDVSSITGSAIAVDSISISWTSNGTETMWDYEYGTTGFTSGSGTTVLGVTNTYDTIANLTPGTSYDVYVRSNCGGSDQGVWMGPIAVNTPVANDNPCDAINLTVGTVGNYSNFGSTNTFDPGNSSNKTVWFKFTAPASGYVAIATCGTPYDTELSVFDTLSDCADITQYNEIGYADYNPYGCSGSHPAGIELCGLTAGEEYLFKIGAWSSSSSEGVFPLLIWDLQYDAGTDTTVSACLGDTVNLVQAISDSYSVTTTTWSYPANPTAILNDTLALTNNFTIGANAVMHIASNSCMADTAYATVNISQMANSGTAVSPFNGCNTGDVYLMDGLTGTVDAGGTWTYDNGSSVGILAGNVFIASGLNLGSYQFTYTADNGACPSASTQITVDLQNCVGIEESNNTYGIYPNPNNGTFNIESNVDGMTSIEVMDIQGKVVFTSTINMTNGVQSEIAIPSIEVGTYLLRVSNNENVTVKTLIIK